MEVEGTNSVRQGFGFNAYLYATLYEVIAKNSQKLARCVPDFIIKESLRHFEGKEQYEKCFLIKSFFDKNPSRMMHMSRADWMDHGWQAIHVG